MAAAVFVLGALIVRRVPPLADQVQGILDFARQGNLPVVLVVTAISGVGEEVFFRGAVYSVLSVLWGLQRRSSGGVLAPILTHITWSLTMAVVLPPLFG